jgi:TRAP transporter TAXI family solute receptor
VSPAPERPIRLDAAAGGAGGSWYVLLEGLARLVREVHPWIELRVIEGGGVMNHANIGKGRPPMAILNPPMTVAARAGRPPFDNALPDLRVGIANLTINHLQFVVDREVPIGELRDWPTRRYPLRVPVDRIGTVDRLVFELALDQLGITPAALLSWGGGLVPADNYHQQLSLYRERRVDALWQFMGIPSPSIQDAHAARPIKPLALPEDLIARLTALGWSAAELPAGAYGVVSSPVRTVAMGTSLGFHASVPADVVFAITAAICDNPERVRAIHPAATFFEPSRAHLELGGPLHEGAARYFEARGVPGVELR